MPKIYWTALEEKKWTDHLQISVPNGVTSVTYNTCHGSSIGFGPLDSYGNKKKDKDSIGYHPHDFKTVPVQDYLRSQAKIRDERLEYFKRHEEEEKLRIEAERKEIISIIDKIRSDKWTEEEKVQLIKDEFDSRSGW